jgi:hypothetical protein
MASSGMVVGRCLALVFSFRYKDTYCAAKLICFQFKTQQLSATIMNTFVEPEVL